MSISDRIVQRPRQNWAALWVGIWTILAIAAAYWCVPEYLKLLRPERGQLLTEPNRLPIVDFFQDWASARNVLEGQPVYEPQLDSLRRYLPDEVPPDSRGFNDVNAHPPTSVLLVLPFGLLDYQPATELWNLLSLGLLVVSGLVMIRQLNIRLAARWLLPLIVLLLLSAPLRQQVYHAQLNLVLLLLLTGTWAADRCGRPVLAGMLLGTATMIKLFPAFIFLLFLLRKEWRVLAAGAAWGVLLTLATAAVLGPDCYLIYIRDVIPQVREWRSAWGNNSLPGLFARLFDPGAKGFPFTPLVQSGSLTTACTILSALVVIALLTWKVRRLRTLADRDCAFAAFVVAMLLLAPLTWGHALTITALPVAIMWAHSSLFSFRRGVLVLVLLLLIRPSFYQILLLQEARTVTTIWPAQTLTVLSVSLYALVVLFLLGLAGPGKREEVADGKKVDVIRGDLADATAQTALTTG
jgi:hypothetical protein